ncbi:hypothetical protein [Streptomyces swartbergensis]|uniref:hypothetical protein n=1 Tax=Streptomyces swartbergensis TaxID=487165 RepID=UPI001FCA155F|nr:hypothetical protein [Streptomyces swartbergensis]
MADVRVATPLHLVGYSFGGRFLCEAVQRAAERPAVLGWSTPPLRGPLVLTHSRWDRATGFWHLRAEKAPGIGHSGAHSDFQRPEPAHLLLTPAETLPLTGAAHASPYRCGPSSPPLGGRAAVC